MDFPSALAILASPGGHAVPRAEAESIVQAVVNDPSRGIQALCHALDCDGTRRLAAVLLNRTRYDKVVEALGGHGEHVTEPGQMQDALRRAKDSGLPALVNVEIRQDREYKGGIYV